jgi:transcriptional regulator with XRE-family HTH domain
MQRPHPRMHKPQASAARHPPFMATTERAVDRARRRARSDRLQVGSDLRLARIGSGLSLAEVARVVRLSPSQISRIERGLAPAVTNEQQAIIGGAVGLDIRTRAYPGSDPIRDASQSRLLDRLGQRIAPSLGFRREVGLPIEGDLRAWDGWIDRFTDGSGEPDGLAVEAETRIADGQAFLRRLGLKMRDGGVTTVLVVVANTRANRAAVAAIELMGSEQFPVGARRALAALAAGRHPGGSAIVFL